MATRGRGGGTRTVRGSSIASNPVLGDANAPLCSHKEPAVRLECKNGQNRGRFFWKCNRPVVSEKCRFFRWEDGAPTSSPTFAGPSSPTTFTSSQAFQGQGQSLTKSTYGSTQVSSNTPQRSTPAPPSSPGKRRRMEYEGIDEVQDEDSYSSHPLRQTKPSPRGRSTVPALSQSQILSQGPSVEDAINDDWDEEIEDFEDFEAGGSGKKIRPGNAPRVGEPASPTRRFTSFAASPSPSKPNGITATPTTPPKLLAPGLPVTPDSVADGHNRRAVTPHGVSRWQQIRDDPSSPFHARASALLDGSSQESDPSPHSGGTSSLFAPDNLSSAGDGNSSAAPRTTYETPTKTLLSEESTSPAKSARSASAHITQFSNMLLSDLETLAKQSEATERQLKAAKQKALYHEKREKELQAELTQMKEKLRLVQSDNDQLKMMLG